MYCSKCGVEINSEDKFCSSCGKEIGNSQIENKITDTSNDLPSEVSFTQDIGGRIWTAKNLTTKYKGGSCLNIKEGPTAIVFHKNGLKIHSGVFKKFEIPYSNIITVQYEDRDSLGNYKTKDKSVVGRAVAGGLLLGPLGAVVGGMSGIGTKSKKLDQESDYLVINYWDKSTKSNEALLFTGKNKRSEYNKFVSDFLKRKSQSRKVLNENHSTPKSNSFTPKSITTKKKKSIALILSVLFGYWGVDRFYLGYVGLGLAKFITAGGFGIWWLIDIVLIAQDKVIDSDNNKLK
jgi:hypothetical protein